MTYNVTYCKSNDINIEPAIINLLLQHTITLKTKGNSNSELGTAICYVNVENYFLTIKSILLFRAQS